MTLIPQVASSPIASVTRGALLAVETAIEDAWADTRRQVGEEDYDKRIIQTAFGQFLVHNVMNCVYKLDAAYPGIAAELVPNERASSYHIRVNIHGLFITISSVPDVHAGPRHAEFRANYAMLQGYFRINKDNRFEASPPPELDEPTGTYMQILHGPKADSRQELGFVLVAFPNRFGNYEQNPMPMDHFLHALLQNGTTDEEIIDDISDLEIV